MRKIKIKYGKDGIRAKCPYCKYICKLTKEVEIVDICDHYIYIQGEYAFFITEKEWQKKVLGYELYNKRKEIKDENKN